MSGGSLIDRLMSKVEKRPNGCWEWTGPINSWGYGVINVRHDGRKTTSAAHKVFYELFAGPVKPGMRVDHYKCYNHACVNPEHLREVTHARNCDNRAGLNSNNTSGVRGVKLDRRCGKWHALLKRNGVVYSLGYHSDIADAKAAVDAKRAELDST